MIAETKKTEMTVKGKDPEGAWEDDKTGEHGKISSWLKDTSKQLSKD